MFDASESNLAKEVSAAVDFRKRHTDLSRQLIQRYAGRNWRSDWKRDTAVYQPHEFEYVANFLPQLIYANPAVEARSDLPGFGDEAADAIEQGINGLLPQIRFDKTARMVAMDMLFDFGVFMVGLDTVPGFERSPSPPLRPTVWRQSPRMFFADPRATSPETWRYAGHMWIRDRDQLKAMMADGQPVYDHAALDALPKDAGIEELVKELLQPTSGVSEIDRNDVIGIEVWLPELNQVFTLGCAGGHGLQSAKMIRAPRPYKGPPSGPYRLCGIYSVPDQLYPLSPLAVTSDKADEFNKHAQKAARDSAAAKRLLLVNAANEALKNGITISPDGGVIAVPGFKNEFAEVEFGGTQNKTLEYLALLKADLDRQSGMSDIQRGHISGRATATEIAEAAAGASIRVRAAQTVFRECVAGALTDMAWFMWHSEHVQIPLRAEVDGVPMAKLFVGGGAEVPFDSLRLTIEPYSMEMVSQATLQSQATETVSVVMQAVPMMAQFPTFPWDALLDDFGESRNRRELGKRYAAPFMQQALIQQQLMAMAAAGGQSRDRQEEDAA